MSEIYEYRTVTVARGAWGRLARSYSGAFADATTRAGGSPFLLCAGMIGLASDEGVLTRAWPDVDAMAARAERTMAAADGVTGSNVERLVPTVRPLTSAAPAEPGVYAHRWFWIQPQDQDEFVRVSDEGVWPFFEADGCRIIGLWRSMEPGPLAKLLLITRYRDVTHWERTRPQAPEPPPGADDRLYALSRDAVRRRAEMTQRSIVRLTRILLPDGR